MPVSSTIYSLLVIFLFLTFTVVDTFSSWPIAAGVPGFDVLASLRIALALGSLLLAAVVILRLQANHDLVIYRTNHVPKADQGDLLLILRFFAFFCVWVTHSVITLKPPEFMAAGTKYFWLIGCAHAGMTVFFTLSGFLMAKAFATGRYIISKDGILSFYMNRCLRIWPLYFIAAGVVTILHKPSHIFLGTTENWIRLFTFNFYASRTQDGPIGALWSLTTEMHYYFLVPFIFILCSRFLRTQKSALIGIAIAMVYGIVLRAVLTNNGADWYAHRYTPLYANLDAFLCGFFLNGISKQCFTDSGKYSLSKVPWLAIFFTSIAFIFTAGAFWEYSSFFPKLLYGVKRAPSFDEKHMFFLPTAIIGLTMFSIYSSERATVKYAVGQVHSHSKWTLKTLHALQFAGILTYSLYVWHPPILESLAVHFSESSTVSNYIGRSLCVLIALFLWSFFSYELIEKPFEKMKSFGRKF